MVIKEKQHDNQQSMQKEIASVMTHHYTTECSMEMLVSPNGSISSLRWAGVFVGQLFSY